MEAWEKDLSGCVFDDLGDLLTRLTPDGKGKKKTATQGLTVRKPLFHHGDMEVKGRLLVQAPLVVTGHLIVQGLFRDCGPQSRVVVGGNLRAANVYTDGEVWVGGNVVARGIVYGYYNDNSLSAQRIEARIVVADDHDIQAQVKASDLHLDIDACAAGKGWRKLVKLIAEDVLVDGRFDNERLLEALLEGREVLR
jgi:hypothetical protein